MLPSVYRAAGAGLLVAILCGAAGADPAAATVRFGNGVFIGGHDFSNETYDRKHRARIRLYDKTPRHEGCVWRADGQGRRIRICNLRRIRSR